MYACDVCSKSDCFAIGLCLYVYVSTKIHFHMRVKIIFWYTKQFPTFEDCVLSIAMWCDVQKEKQSKKIYQKSLSYQHSQSHVIFSKFSNVILFRVSYDLKISEIGNLFGKRISLLSSYYCKLGWCSFLSLSLTILVMTIKIYTTHTYLHRCGMSLYKIYSFRLFGKFITTTIYIRIDRNCV